MHRYPLADVCVWHPCVHPRTEAHLHAHMHMHNHAWTQICTHKPENVLGDIVWGTHLHTHPSTHTGGSSINIISKSGASWCSSGGCSLSSVRNCVRGMLHASFKKNAHRCIIIDFTHEQMSQNPHPRAITSRLDIVAQLQSFQGHQHQHVPFLRMPDERSDQ